MQPIKLSVVIITFNEERNIGRCLDAIAPFADDVIVVDSFSSDQTESICKERGVRFVQHIFEGHIQQKNWAITQARFPHVLSLDADEAPNQELVNAIIAAKNNWAFDGYTMNRLTNYCGQWIRHCGWYPDTKLRLWDSRKGSWQGLNPHDRYELNDAKSPIQHLTGDLLHYSYYTVEEHYRQAAKFSTIAAQAAFQAGKKSNLLLAAIKTWAKFIRNYVVNAGFLDGRYGFVICKITAYETWQKYTKLQKLWRTSK